MSVTTLKLILEYDGTDFSGWQSQANGRTVQDVVEAAIAQVTGEKIRIAGAGRTDAGVHASGQVASCTLAGEMIPRQLQKSLNGVLPEDVIVRSVEPVAQDFHARFSARARTYAYTISVGPTALRRRTCWSVGWELNTSYLDICASKFRGKHTFQSFSKAGSDVTDWRCDVLQSIWTREGDLLVYTIQANRFLYGMVRALVGTMVEVGRSYRPVEDIDRILAGSDRALAGMAAPAHGLCLVDITY